MRKILMVTAAALAVGVVVGGVGCSSSLCSYSMACPNDTKPTQDQITTAENNCKAQENMYRSDPCFNDFESFGSCEKNNIACDATGKTDGAGTQAKIAANCGTQLANAKACCAKNTSSGLCK
jgi:hypothetical protein